MCCGGRVPHVMIKGPQRCLFAILLCLAVANPAARATTPGEIPIGGTLRDATLQGLNGPSRRLTKDDYFGSGTAKSLNGSRGF
jgi:hypothetical protein